MARPTEPRPGTRTNAAVGPDAVGAPQAVEARVSTGGPASAGPAAPGTTPAPARLQSLPSWLLSRASGLAASLVDDALSADGLRRQDYRVLVALDEAGAASQADLGRTAWLDRSDLHGVVTMLEERGLVAREGDPADRRRKLVTLTPVGRTTLANLDARVDAAQALLLDALSERDRAAFVRSLRALVGIEAT